LRVQDRGLTATPRQVECIRLCGSPVVTTVERTGRPAAMALKRLHLGASAPNSEREEVVAWHADSDLIPELLVKFDEIPPQIGLAALI
jgi:hypothetical protein